MNKSFESARSKAKSYAEDKTRTRDLLQQAMKKAREDKGFLKRTWDDLNTLFRLVSLWAKGEYKDLSKQSIIMIIGAILYFVTPIDAIFDFIPGLGYLDDVAVIGFVFKNIKKDIDAFLAWEHSNKHITDVDYTEIG